MGGRRVLADLPDAQLAAGGGYAGWGCSGLPGLTRGRLLPQQGRLAALHAARSRRHIGKRHKSHCFGRLEPRLWCGHFVASPSCCLAASNIRFGVLGGANTFVPFCPPTFTFGGIKGGRSVKVLWGDIAVTDNSHAALVGLVKRLSCWKECVCHSCGSEGGGILCPVWIYLMHLHVILLMFPPFPFFFLEGCLPFLLGSLTVAL